MSADGGKGAAELYLRTSEPAQADLCIGLEHRIRDAMERMDRNGKGIVLAVDEGRRLIGTVTDGDIRRGILAGLTLDSSIASLLSEKGKSQAAHPPYTAPVDADRESLLRMMQEHVIYQVPLLNESGQVAGLVTMDELLSDRCLPVRAVIMAGGFGTRLHPLTRDLPKPMLPVGDQPLMQRIIEQLQRAGVRRISITTHYQAEKITSYFGDGRRFGVEISYVREDKPLGTAGALSLLDPPTEPLLIMNGDILTQVDFRALHAYHVEHESMLTIGVRSYELKVPYGVVRSDGSRVVAIEEKPSLRFFVNGGIYLLAPEAHRFIPKFRRFDMTDLIATLIDHDLPVVSFPILEYWLDIGQHVDYERAQEDVRVGRFAA